MVLKLSTRIFRIMWCPLMERKIMVASSCVHTDRTVNFAPVSGSAVCENPNPISKPISSPANWKALIIRSIERANSIPYISSPIMTEASEANSSGTGLTFCLITGKSITEKEITIRAFTGVGTPAELKMGSMKRMMLMRSRIDRRMASSEILTLKDNIAGHPARFGMFTITSRKKPVSFPSIQEPKISSARKVMKILGTKVIVIS